MEKLSEAESNAAELQGPLTAAELISIGQVLRTTSALPVSILIQEARGCQIELDFGLVHAASVNIMGWFPVLTVTRRHTIVAVNLHEAVLEEELVEDLLSLDAGGSTTVNNGEQNHNEQQEQQEQQPRRQQQHNPGPPKGQGDDQPSM